MAFLFLFYQFFSLSTLLRSPPLGPLSALTAAPPRPLRSNFFGGPAAPCAQPSPLSPRAASVLERGAELALRAQVWGEWGGWGVFSGGGGGCAGPINQAVSFLSLSLPRVSFRLVMPRSGCRLPRACALLVAGGETWKQQTKKRKKKYKKKQMKRKQMNIELG